ncbi:15874_t:CDS:2 [Dentiscutata erythropus]|uniref:15874_t:CDS:1 n=1 Tax=Dentiscutata erythropus TaxID=1348616 RepID=A0A9N9B4L0_9GLOM|nr:15874_t:CDS:2 [Dentiscutata erythropus]
MFQFSFSPQYYEALERLKKNFNDSKDITIEAKKQYGLIPVPTPDECIVDETKLDERYVIKSKEYLVNRLKIYEDVIDEKWQDLDNDGLSGEWVKIKDRKDTGRVVLFMFGGGYYMGSPKVCRNSTYEIAKNAECSVFAINYRLSPEHQFPVALCDALAAYLYLTDPPLETGLKPIDPKQIIFAGPSAGGGLAVATALFIRDVGLPLPSGLVLWSPWVDLMASMPSYWKPEMDKTDFIAGALNVCKLVPRFNLYCANEALAIPYVSPMLAESLGNLPPILCQVGGGERFLDSNILFSFRASDPSKFQIPKYATMNFVNSPFKKPTDVTLEVYEGACHCFQRNNTLNESIPKEAENKSFQGIQKTINTIAINPNCDIKELDEKFLECLNWENIGVVPELEAPKPIVRGFPRTAPPRMSPSLQTLLSSQAKSLYPTLPVPKHKPLYPSRKANLLWRHYSKIMKTVMPPVDNITLDQLEKNAGKGTLTGEGVANRSILSRNHNHDEPNRLRILKNTGAPKSPRDLVKEGPYCTARPHNPRPRFIRRLYQRLLTKIPIMKDSTSTDLSNSGPYTFKNENSNLSNVTLPKKRGIITKSPWADGRPLPLVNHTDWQGLDPLEVAKLIGEKKTQKLKKYYAGDNLPV